jgi:hypothetical protein
MFGFGIQEVIVIFLAIVVLIVVIAFLMGRRRY